MTVARFHCDGTRQIQSKTRFFKNRRTEREKAPAQTGSRRLSLYYPETRCQPVALRFSAGDGGSVEVVGAPQRSAMVSRRKASRCGGGGSPGGIWEFRRSHPGRSIWGRNRHAL